MASIWIASEQPGLARAVELAMAGVGELLSGPPERAAWIERPDPDLVVLVGASPGPDPFDVEAVERLLAFVSGIRRFRRPPVPVLYVEPPGADGQGALVAPLIDDRPGGVVGWPPDPEEIHDAARRLLHVSVSPATLRERSRIDWVRSRVELLYAGLELPALRRAIDPRSSGRPVLLVGEPGTRRALLSRYIHQLAEPRRHRFLRLSDDALRPGRLEARVLEGTRGVHATVYVASVDRARRAVQAELAELLTGSGGTALESVRWIVSADRYVRLMPQLRLAPWIRVGLPPLRERTDLEELAGGLVAEFARRTRREIAVSPSVPRALAEHAWPGNLAELEGVLEASLDALRGDVLDASDLHLLVGREEPTPAATVESEPAGIEVTGLPAVERMREEREVPPPEPEAPTPDLPETDLDQDVDLDPDLPEADLLETPSSAPHPPTPDLPETDLDQDVDLDLPEADLLETEALATSRAATGTTADRGEGKETDLGVLPPLVEELRSALLALRTYGALASQQPGDPEIRRRLGDLLDRDVHRLQDTLDRVDTFSRLGSPEISSVDVGDLLASALADRRDAAREQGLVVLEEIERGGEAARADAAQLRFAIDAILDRVLRMVPRSGDLFVGHRALPGSPRTGPRHRILIRFHSPEEVLTPPDESGAGGMPVEVLLARSVLEGMGGRLAVDVSGPQDNLVLIELPA